MRLFDDFTCRGKLITNQRFLAQLVKKAQDEIAGIGTEEKLSLFVKLTKRLALKFQF